MSRDDNFDPNASDDSSQQSSDGNSPYGYNTTPHPEDAPEGFNGQWNRDSNQDNGSSSFPYSQSYPSTPGNDNAYGNGYEGYTQGYGVAEGSGASIPMEQANGQIDVMRAVSYGFRSVFSNAAVWILGTFLLGLAFVALSLLIGFALVAVSPDSDAFSTTSSASSIFLNVFFAVLAIAVTVFILRGALTEVSGRKARFRDFFAPVNVAQTVVLLVVLSGVSYLFTIGIDSMYGEVVSVNQSTGEIAVNDSALIAQLVFVLILVLINPLYAYWTWYTADGRHTAMDAARTGLRDAARNYVPLLIFSIVSSILIVVATVITFALALIILGPVMLLINAHLYRQMSGGAIPVNTRS